MHSSATFFFDFWELQIVKNVNTCSNKDILVLHQAVSCLPCYLSYVCWIAPRSGCRCRVPKNSRRSACHGFPRSAENMGIMANALPHSLMSEHNSDINCFVCACEVVSSEKKSTIHNLYIFPPRYIHNAQPVLQFIWCRLHCPRSLDSVKRKTFTYWYMYNHYCLVALASFKNRKNWRYTCLYSQYFCIVELAALNNKPVGDAYRYTVSIVSLPPLLGTSHISGTNYFADSTTCFFVQGAAIEPHCHSSTVCTSVLGWCAQTWDYFLE